MDEIQGEFERAVRECGDESMSPEERRAAMGYFRQGWVRAKRRRIFAIANNALYFDDSSDFRSALWQVCAEASPEQSETIGRKYVEEDAQPAHAPD